MSDEILSRIVYFDEAKNLQVRLGINEFRGVEYLFLRKYYQDFDGEWMPSKEGVNMPLGIENSKEMFRGLVEILSLAEAKQVIEEEFKELVEGIYQ
jgi:TPP-dependent indolepyruvate ferredoxin oxidoreductase alpha subunit